MFACFLQIMVSTKNRLYYCGLNPGSLRSLLNARKHENKGNSQPPVEEKDYADPILIDTSHMAGEISKVYRYISY